MIAKAGGNRKYGLQEPLIDSCRREDAGSAPLSTNDEPPLDVGDPGVTCSSWRYRIQRGAFLAPAKPQGLSLRQNFSWILVGNISYAACQWAMLVTLVKLGTPAMVGQFSLAFAVTAPVITFACLNLRAVQATDIRRDYQFSDYLGLRLSMLGLALVLILGLVQILGYDGQLTLSVLAVALAKTLDAISDVVFGLLQQHERMDRIGISYALKGLLQLTAFAATIYLTKSVLAGNVALVGASASILLLYDGPSAARILSPRALVPRFSKNTLARIATISAPLGIITLFDSLNANIPRYFIEALFGHAQLGYYSAIAYIMAIGQTAVGALGDAARPRLARHFNHDILQFKALLRKLLWIGGALGAMSIAGALIFGQAVIRILYRPDYAVHNAPLVWLMIAAAVWYLVGFQYTALTAARKFAAQSVLSAAATACTALACLVMVPQFGLAGAGVALSFGMAVRLTGTSLILTRVLHAAGSTPENHRSKQSQQKALT